MATSREQGLVQEALPSYEVGAELGRGAFGVVYIGTHRELGREVAIKQLPRAFAADPGVRERFVAEAQMVARLDHPHIVPVYDFVNRDDGMCLIIMERCTGAVSDRFQSDGLATDEACAALLAACAALDFAHGAGVLHRDIKPENLLYDTKGVVKLADFGIARALDASARRTATGMVIGTPAYMSPEQVRGEDLTPASDVYSVGIMGFELLTGGFPFAGANSATGLLAHHLVTEPTPLTTARSELPPAIGAVIDRSLSKDIESRHASAAEFAIDLTGACVASFGAGWLRRRRFVLHWPEVIAESEKAREDGARTGTIMVKAEPSRTDLAGARGLDDPPSLPTVAPTGDAAVAASVPLSNATVAPTGDAPVAVAPSAVPPAAVPPAGQPPMATGGTPPAAPASGRDNNRTLVVVGVICALVAVGLLALVLTSGGSDDEPTAAPTTTAAGSDDPDTPVDPAPTTAPPVAPTTEAVTPTVPVTPQRDEAEEVIVDSPWTATPCPVEPPEVGCILGVSVDTETGEMTVPYQVFGFVPELEPADMHLHFYFDVVVAGDERKAGSEVPGGSWKPWDGILPFTSFGGENGRTGFTMADAEAAGARTLCVLVADADQRAIPGTGNCAPIPYPNDPEIALEQVDRLTGTYAGSCGVGATMIIPEGWRWLDLVANEPAEAARVLRPGDVDTTTEILENLVGSGGVLWADGPTEGDFIVNANIVRIEGDYTSIDTPDEVRARLSQSGIGLDGTGFERTFGGRDVVGQVVDRAGAQVIQYVIPDFGYALLLNVLVPDAAQWQETADAMAATLRGC